jgi:sugar O-acyltransferase (sialic acid O-acetyltransferase NeuD family)
MSPPALVIAGAGGFGRETAQTVHAINLVHPTWELLGHLDDNPDLGGADVGGLPVVGPLDWLISHDVATVVTIGSPKNFSLKAQIVSRLGLPESRFATIVHPTAALASSTTIGHGTVISAACVTTADVTIGSHVAMMPACVLTHDNVIESFVTMGAGVRLAGTVTIESGAYVGAGAMIREQCRIGRGALIGMGAVVTTDVPAGETWAGVPARRIRSASTSRGADRPTRTGGAS